MISRRPLMTESRPILRVICAGKRGCGKEKELNFDEQRPTKCGRCANTELVFEPLEFEGEQAQLGI